MFIWWWEISPLEAVVRDGLVAQSATTRHQMLCKGCCAHRISLNKYWDELWYKFVNMFKDHDLVMAVVEAIWAT